METKEGHHFTGSEMDADCQARLKTGRMVHLVSDSPDNDLDGKLPLEEEIPAKVISTLAAIFGGKINSDPDMSPLFSRIAQTHYRDRTLDVVLFLGGDIEHMVAVRGKRSNLTHFKQNMERALSLRLRWVYSC